jgi:hypothetical protein
MMTRFAGVEFLTFAEEAPVVPAYAEAIAPRQPKARSDLTGRAHQALRIPGAVVR